LTLVIAVFQQGWYMMRNGRSGCFLPALIWENVMDTQSEPDTNDGPPSDNAGRPHGRRWIAIAAALLVIAGGTAAIVAWRVQEHRFRFGIVEEGALYRCAQPNGGRMKDVLAKYQIRTTVNLRQPSEMQKDRKAAEEIAFAGEHGIQFINIPYDDEHAQAQIRQFLAIVADPANRPVLVHCAAGKERSGVMTAAYRMRVQGWPLEQALAEMRQYGYMPEEHPNFQAAVEEFSRSLSSAPGK
jgi:protein tyrosine phosphatase (PTP) superfamily phosphohydrolase (DUF442 family)